MYINSAVSTIEVENMVHSDSRSQNPLRIRLKLSQVAAETRFDSKFNQMLPTNPSQYIWAYPSASEASSPSGGDQLTP